MKFFAVIFSMLLSVQAFAGHSSYRVLLSVNDIGNIKMESLAGEEIDFLVTSKEVAKGLNSLTRNKTYQCSDVEVFANPFRGHDVVQVISFNPLNCQ